MSEKFLNSARVSELWAKIKDALSGKQDTFTVGRGLSKDNDTLNVDLPSMAMTQEEYDALPVEEKNSDTLFILPGDMPGAVTMDQVNAAIDAAITGAMEDAY